MRGAIENIFAKPVERLAFDYNATTETTLKNSSAGRFCACRPINSISTGKSRRSSHETWLTLLTAESLTVNFRKFLWLSRTFRFCFSFRASSSFVNPSNIRVMSRVNQQREEEKFRSCLFGIFHQDGSIVSRRSI